MGVIAAGRRLLNRRYRLFTRSTRRTIAEVAVVIAAVVVGVVIGASLERTQSNSEPRIYAEPDVCADAPGHVDPQHGHRDEGVGPDARAACQGHWAGPIYWSGPRPNYTYELTLAPNAQRVYLRYLPPGVPLGSPRPDYLSIGTYSVRGAAAALRARAGRTGRGRA